MTARCERVFPKIKSKPIGRDTSEKYRLISRLRAHAHRSVDAFLEAFSKSTVGDRLDFHLIVNFHGSSFSCEKEKRKEKKNKQTKRSRCDETLPDLVRLSQASKSPNYAIGVNRYRTWNFPSENTNCFFHVSDDNEILLKALDQRSRRVRALRGREFSKLWFRRAEVDTSLGVLVWDQGRYENKDNFVHVSWSIRILFVRFSARDNDDQRPIRFSTTRKNRLKSIFIDATGISSGNTLDLGISYSRFFPRLWMCLNMKRQRAREKWLKMTLRLTRMTHGRKTCFERRNKKENGVTYEPRGR